MKSGLIFGALFIALLAATIVVIELVRVPDMYSVDGHGTVKYRPDAAKIGITVVARANVVTEATTETAAAMRKLLATLKAAGVADADIASAAIDSGPTEPPYRAPGTPVPPVPNFTAVQSITVTVRDLGHLPAVLNAVSGAAPQFWHVDFFVADEEALNIKARNAALADAIKRADAYSSGGGFKRGRILKIQEGQTFFPYVDYPSRRYITSRADVDQLLNTLPQVAPAPPPPAPPPADFEIPQPEERSAQSTVSVLFEIK